MRQTHQRLRLALGVSAIAVAAALTVTTPAFAQATATMQGHVASAAAGTTVTATDTVTGQAVTTTVAADGSYTIVGLRPSTYHVTAGQASEDVTLPVGVTTTVDLDAAGTGTVVTVVGRRGRDVHTAEIATSVSQKQMENLPQNDRNFLNFAALAPGVSVSTGNKTFQAGGVGPDQVNVFIDGQSYKNQTAHGGVAGQAFTPGNPFPQLAVQEFKVDSQNFKAEFEQAGSAIIQAVTKSGGSEFHGDVFTEYTNKDMEARPYFDRPGNANNPNGTNPKPDYKRYQYGFDFGGPIIKNVLHFYTAAEVNDTTNPSTAVNLSDPTIPSSIKTAENGSFAAPFKQTLLFGKLTWFANDADTLDLSAFGRKEDNNIDYGGNRTRSGARNVRSNEIEGLLEWKHRGANFLNEMSFAYQDSQIGTPDLTDGPQLSLYNGSGVGTTTVNMDGTTTANFNAGGDVADMGAQNFTQNSGQKLYTLKDNITFTSFDWHGSHVIKAGFKYAKTTLSRAENNNTNGTYNYLTSGYTGTSTDPSSSIPWSASLNVMPPTTFHANNNNIGLFVQDDWTVNEHLTYNLGIRWDYESNMMNNKFVTPTAIVNALAAYTNWTAAGIDYHDYVSTGSNRKAFTGAFQPRLGVTYDVNGDRDLVFFAGWGRYYDRDVFLSGQIETVQDTAERIVTANFCGASGLPNCYDTDNNGKEDNGRIAWTSSLKDPNALRSLLLANGTGGSVWLLNNKTKVPYSDNLDLGFRKRVGDATWSVSYQHNMSYHVFQYVRGNRLPDGTFTSKGDGWTEDNFPIQGQLPGFSGKLNIGESNGKSRYNAIFITVDKPYSKASHYGYTGALTIADSKSTGSELGADEFFEGPHQDTFGYTHSLGVSKYRFVGTGIVDGPWQTTISATLTLATGTPFGSIDATQPAPENACCRVNLGGVYFPHGIAYQELDARIAKDFTLPNGNVITLDGQVYNLFDHVNRAYSAWGAGSNWGGGAPLLENSTQGPARTFQVGLKYKF